VLGYVVRERTNEVLTRASATIVMRLSAELDGLRQ
jgi:hypothetical protein